MPPRASRHSVPVLVLVLGVFAAATTVAADLQVTPPGEPTTIGRDLVLELKLPAGTDVAPDDIEVTVAGEGLDAALGEPYGLKSLGGGRYSWSAPTTGGAEPRTYPIVVTARYPDGEETVEVAWEGEVGLDFGGEWSAQRITWFIADRGLPLFLLIVFGFGVLMSFTPCVYPMIPITLAVIGAQSQEKGIGKGFLLAATYGLGLALVYAVIGAVSATVFSGITAFLQSPVVLVPIAVLMVGLSFAQFGAYELQAPAFLRDRLQGPGGNRAGVAGAFIMGMIAGLVASPCVGPFLAAVLVWVGTTGSVFLGFWSLFVFGLGLSLLLVCVGTFPAAMGSLPQSGGWMETVKKAMGLLLLYMAFFFVRPGLVLPAKIFFPLLGAVTVVVAVFVGAFDRLRDESTWWDRARKGIGWLFFAAGLWLLVGSWYHNGFLLPALQPEPVTVMAAAPAAAAGAGATVAAEAPLPEEVEWHVVHTGEDVMDFIEDRRAEAKAAGQPIVLDFWATWCAYCKKLDKHVWNDPAVVRESQRFLPIKVDATKPDDDDMMAVKELFGVPGLPTIAFIGSGGEILQSKTVSGYRDAEQMLAIMQSVE